MITAREHLGEITCAEIAIIEDGVDALRHRVRGLRVKEADSRSGAGPGVAAAHRGGRCIGGWEVVAMPVGMAPGVVVAAGQAPLSNEYCWKAAANCLKSFAMREASDRSWMRWMAAMARAASRPMTATTTINSTSVKARRQKCGGVQARGFPRISRPVTTRNGNVSVGTAEWVACDALRCAKSPGFVVPGSKGDREQPRGRRSSPHNARAAAGEGLLNFLPCGHGRVAGRRRGERAVGGAIFDSFLGVVELEETELQAGGEGITAADAVEDFEFGIFAALVELAVVPENRGPVVFRGSDDATERGGGDLEVFEFLHGRLDHRLEGIGLNGADVVVNALHLEAERGGEVLLVANHHVDVFGNFAVDLLRLLQAADGFPERRAVVEIVTDDRAVLVGGLDGLDGELRGGGGERREDAAGVEPADAEFAEDVVPIEVAGLELRGGGIAAIGVADGAADAEAALGEVEPVADGAADAVVLAPLDEVGGDAALHDEVLDEGADQ